MLKNMTAVICLILGLNGYLSANENPMMDSILELQTSWADIKYQTPDEDDQINQLNILAEQAEKLVSAYPYKAEPKIWYGIILSTKAGLAGGLGALKDVKHAKKLFEDSLEIDPESLNGSAYTSLGALYYQVPGWPIGFGDDKKAEMLLQKSLSINPDGIDSLYFYGEYLIDQKRYTEAEQVLKHALKAAPRPERQVADAGRRQEIRSSLSTIKSKLH